MLKLIPESNPITASDIKSITDTDLPWENLRNKTVLVSGGGGFLAAYLIKSILAASRIKKLNAKVLCLARSQRSVQARLQKCLESSDFMLIEHDIAQTLPAELPRADFVIHAASQASPKYYGVDPVGTLLANSSGTMHLLDHARKHQSERFMFFSSGEIYGIPTDPDRPTGELDYGYVDSMQVRSCYAESKRMGETMCASWTQQFGLHTCVVRPFHTYGPGMALNDGRVFADFVADAVAHRDIVVKSDGLAIRPFCYLSDATIGFLTVLFAGKSGEAYNVGNPNAEISIRDLATLIARLFPERKINTKFEISAKSYAYLKSPIARSCPAIEKIKKLGWEPKIGLEEGFRRTIESFSHGSR